MDEEHLGKNYQISLSATDIAKKIRQHIKTSHPGWKFSVRVSQSTYTSRIDIVLQNAPIRVLKPLEELKKTLSSWEYESIKSMLENDKFRYDISSIGGMKKICTDEAYKVMQDVHDYVESYNRWETDIMTDYFEYHFFSFYAVGSYDKPFVEVA